MAEEHFQTIILGGGPGGYPAAIRAAQLGQKVAVIERDKVGGVCLHRGCIPTKALLESAEVYHLASNSSDFGVKASDVSYNYPDIMARKTKIVDQLHKGIEFLLQSNKAALIKGEGTVTSPNSVVVRNGSETKELKRENLVISTGSRPKSLPGLGIDGEHVMFSDHALALDYVPKSIIIIGAGAVGVEFASLDRDLGAEVTIIELMPTIVPLEDRDVGQVLARSFAQRGIKILTETKIDPQSLKLGEGQVQIDVLQGDKRETVTAEKVLVAVGREAILDSVKDLGLETERGYIKVDFNMRTNMRGVYAIGDAIGGYLLAHVATAEGHQAIEAIAGEKVAPIDYTRVPRCTYCRPQIGSMGMSEQEAKDKGHSVKSPRYSFQSHGRALIMGQTEGFAKVVSDGNTGEILGVHIIGPNATELIAEAALGRFLEATPLELGLSIHAHPTLSEAVMEAALAVEGRPVHMVVRR